jgi:hypothetical protein
MSRIKRVEVHEFAFELPDLGWDSSGFNMVYQPDNKLKLSKYAVGRIDIALWDLTGKPLFLRHVFGSKRETGVVRGPRCPITEGAAATPRGLVSKPTGSCARAVIRPLFRA